MTRLALILSLVACSSKSKLDTPAPARNFVCERVAILSPKAKCEPEFALAELHTARITVDGKTDACGLAAGRLAMACDGLLVQPQKQEAEAKVEPQQPAKGAKK